MPQSTVPRGKLIVFEGLDRAGKSTQCEALVKTLEEKGHRVRHLRFPDRTTPIGQMINAYLKGSSEQDDHVIHLLFSANRWEAAAQIEADIKAGVTVVVDRYYYSGMVYSAAKQNASLSLAWARKPDEGLPRPDVCVFLNISPERAAARGGFGEEKYEKREMQDRVRRLFQRLREAPAPEKDDFVAVDGGGTLEEVHESVVGVVQAAMQRVDEMQLPLRRVEPW